MKLNSYHRAIVGYLADAYGVEDAEIASSDSRNTHPVLTFTYAGEPRRMQVHSSGGTHNRDPLNLLALKKQDLRRMLGPLPPPALYPGAKITVVHPRPDQEIVIMEPNQESPAVEAKPFNPLPLLPAAAPDQDKARSWQVGIAIYAVNQERVSLRFMLPDDLVAAWGTPSHVAAEQIGDEDWRITRAGIVHGKPLKPYTGSTGYIVQLAVPAVRCFGRSQAEAVIVVGDSLLVHAPLADRRWSQTAPRFKPEQVAHSAETKKETAPPTQEVVGGTVTAEAMRACLEEIRRIERSCPYRLVRVAETKAWVFSAPRIE
jgi:hypothetical protein